MADQKHTVKFGDICREVKLSSKDPLANGYDKYIGLEHLDSGSLKIKRWGSIAEDNPSFTRVFKKGHILFGKRRPYLKKAAIAEFDGICSGDIIVMEPKGNSFLPELLPFIVQSDGFWDWSIKTSSGSLSPRTKFKSLAEFEILLPDSEGQLQMLEEINLSRQVVSQADFLIEKLNQLLLSLYWDVFGKELEVKDSKKYPTRITANCPIFSLKDLSRAKPQNGLFVKKELTLLNECYFLNVVDGYENSYGGVDRREKTTCTDTELETYRLRNGDLIFNRSSLVRSGIGWPYLVTDEDKVSTFDCHLIRVKIDTTKVLPDYAYIYSLSPWARKYFLCVGQTTTMTTISQGDLEGLMIPVPSIDKQKLVVDAFIKLYEHQRKTIKYKSKVMELASIHVSEQLRA